MQKQSIVKIFTGLSALIFIISITLPAPTFAQSRYNDGEYGNVNNWRSGNNAMTQKISSLSSARIESISIPVLFGVIKNKIMNNYGEVRSDGHVHIGIDIMSVEGTPIVSPTEAVVIKTGTGVSAGNYVYTANPGGETFVYMHLSKIANIREGDSLQVGSLIGYVGHTGNASAAAPHLHFEIRDTNGNATDPYPRFSDAFAINQKIMYLSPILNTDSDRTALANLLVSKFEKEFVDAKSQNITLPTEIQNALTSNLVVPTSTSSTTAVKVSTSNSSILKVGSKGPGVLALQTYLVAKKIGSGGSIVADGSFGPKTRLALVEFQASIGFTADGIAGPKTLGYIAAHP